MDRIDVDERRAPKSNGGPGGQDMSTGRWRRCAADLCGGFGLLLMLTAVAPSPTEPAGEPIVTPDSMRGWRPTERLQQKARKAFERVYADLEAGHDEAIYSRMGSDLRYELTYAEFQRRNARFRAEAGAVKGRQLAKLTWSKYSTATFDPGIHAMFYVTSQYERAGRHCGYVRLDLPEYGRWDDYGVSGLANVYLTDARATEIAQTQGSAAVDQRWAEMSATCARFMRDWTYWHAPRRP